MLKKVLSSLFLFAFVLVFSNVSQGAMAASNTKTIKTPSSILNDYAKKVEEKESQITKNKKNKQKQHKKLKKKDKRK